MTEATPSPGPRWQHALSLLATFFRVFAPLLLVMAGLALGLLSLTSDQRTYYSNNYTGSAGPGNATIDLPAVSPGLLQVTDVTGACELRVYPATDAEAIRFNQTGALPASWFGCSNRTVTTSGQVAHLILLNVASFSIPYEINVVAYSVTVPLGWLALPATALVLLGLISFLPRMMAGEIMRFRDEFGRPKKRR